MSIACVKTMFLAFVSQSQQHQRLQLQRRLYRPQRLHRPQRRLFRQLHPFLAVTSAIPVTMVELVKTTHSLPIFSSACVHQHIRVVFVRIVSFGAQFSNAILFVTKCCIPVEPAYSCTLSPMGVLLPIIWIMKCLVSLWCMTLCVRVRACACAFVWLCHTNLHVKSYAGAWNPL